MHNKLGPRRIYTIWLKLYLGGRNCCISLSKHFNPTSTRIWSTILIQLSCANWIVSGFNILQSRPKRTPGVFQFFFLKPFSPCLPCHNVFVLQYPFPDPNSKSTTSIDTVNSDFLRFWFFVLTGCDGLYNRWNNDTPNANPTIVAIIIIFRLYSSRQADARPTGWI